MMEVKTSEKKNDASDKNGIRTHNHSVGNAIIVNHQAPTIIQAERIYKISQWEFRHPLNVC